LSHVAEFAQVSEPSFAREPQSARELFLQFVLSRVVHDFSNAVSGIVSLAGHHLEHDQLEPGLQTSLGMIRATAEQCRLLLSSTGELLYPSADDYAYVRATDLVDGVRRLLHIFLPRSVRLDPAAAAAPAVAVRACSLEFTKRWLAIAGVDCAGLQSRGSLGFDVRTEGGLCWFTYRSANTEWAGRVPDAERILLPLAAGPDAIRCVVKNNGFVAEVALPVVSTG